MKMDCDIWQDKIDAFVDNELPAAELREFESHLRTCLACAAEVVARQRLKAETRAAGLRYEPSAELQARIATRVGGKRRGTWLWWPALAGVAAALVLAVFVGQAWNRQQLQDAMVAQLVDQHVATMASANPADVLSNDSHNVKPWFNGKVPFSVDIPNLENTPYTLIGGKFVYFQQEPAAQLVFGIRKHKISVFMFRDHGETAAMGEERTPKRHNGFQVQTWSEDGLRYVAISDVNADDVRKLCEMLKAAS
jgi:anti-sigma factor RsiW